MHPIGTTVLLEGITMTEYTANSKVLARMFQTFVHSLERIGGSAFPNVLTVSQDAELGDGDCYCVGYSIDMTVDLANVSHLDVHNALPSFSVWTEELPGLATNWYFVMPNLHGIFR